MKALKKKEIVLLVILGIIILFASIFGINFNLSKLKILFVSKQKITKQTELADTDIYSFDKEIYSKFSHDIKIKPKPWSHKKFRNNPNNFQFVIVSDRTSGCRKGVFKSAIKKINLLNPEFVMSIGDLIQGYTKDKESVLKQWNEFNDIIKGLNVPFFYVTGNHDVTNKMMKDLWNEFFGKRYYYFIYKNVLFMCLDSQDTPETAGLYYVSKDAHIGNEQIKWVKKVLKKHPNVRWTCVFMHQPLWTYPKNNGFEMVEKALSERNYTVFAGHMHEYMKYDKSGDKYFVLGTTGGGKKVLKKYEAILWTRLLGIKNGEFDHLMWITMTDKGAIIANLLLDGIYDEDIKIESMKGYGPGGAFASTRQTRYKDRKVLK